MRKKIKQIIAIMVICALLLSGARLMDYLLVDDISSYTRVMMHEFYEQDNIDILMVGASHCFYGTVPSIVSENTGKNVFLASSSAQTPDVSFALIKEAVKHYEIEQVYLELSATIAVETGEYRERTSLVKVYLISDYMRSLFNRSALLLHASSPEHYINSFWIARRTKLPKFDWKAMASLYEVKSEDIIYRDYRYDYLIHDTERYEGNGYVAHDKKIEKSAFFLSGSDNERIDTNKISKDWQNTISDIIDFCDKKDIKLTFYAAPVSNYQLAAEGNYDDYIVYVRNIIEGKKVEYIDFNLLSDNYFPYFSENFMNGDHLNKYGAEAFSGVLSAYMNEELPEDALCESVSKKLEDAKPEYYGIDYLDEENQRKIHLIANRLEAFEYKIELLYDDKDPVILQNFATNNELNIPLNQGGILSVTYRQVGSDKETKITY